MPHTKNTTYFERRHIPLLPWKGSRNTAKERIERVIQGISEFYLKICKNSRAVFNRRTRDMMLTRLFYLLTAQDTSDGYKPHGER